MIREPGRLGGPFCVGGVAHDVMRYVYQGTDFFFFSPFSAYLSMLYRLLAVCAV